MTGSAMPASTAHWLDTQWDFLRSHLPAPPARVIDLGCGPYGGFVPRLRSAGYDARGVDPEAPADDGYHRQEFEQFAPPWPVDAIAASTSLHHTADLARALDQIASTLRPAGVLVVIEWDWERFDRDTARWCFARLNAEGEDGWLRQLRERWPASGQPWSTFISSWAREEHLHTGESIVAELGLRFAAEHLSFGPYFYADLDGVSAEAERAAIAAGELRATGIHFVGTPLASVPTPPAGMRATG
jgi:SAM-dependent methyltransferase